MLKVLSIVLAFAIGVAAAWAADAKAGAAVYDKSCKSCHGPDGAPNATVEKMLKADMKDLKSPEVQALTDNDIKSVITAGKGKMKAVSVTGPALDNVVAYVRS